MATDNDRLEAVPLVPDRQQFLGGFIDDHCVLGTWGCRLYAPPEVNRLASFCIDWLREAPTPTLPDFSEPIRLAYGLRSIPEETFNRWVAEAR